MQNNGISPDFQTNNPFSEHFQKFGKTRLFDRLEQKFTPKPYYYQYRTMRAVVFGASFLFHILSAATAAALIFLFVGKLLPSPMAAGAVTLAALAALEISKRETSGRFFHDALQFGKFSPGLLAVVLALAAISTTCSYFGAERAVKELTPPPALLNADTITAPLRTQIAAIDGQISDAKRNTWKGKVTTRAQRTIDRLTRQRETLVNEQIRQQQRADSRNDATETEHATTTESNAAGFAVFTLCSEVLLILCLWFLQYYDYRSFAEYCAKPDGKASAGFGSSKGAAGQATEPTTAGSLAAELLSKPANGNGSGNLPTNEAPRRPIGFFPHPDAGNGSVITQPLATQHKDPFFKVCDHCGENYHAAVRWQKFCTNDCKMAYHEAKHGRKFDPMYKRKPKAVNS